MAELDQAKLQALGWVVEDAGGWWCVSRVFDGRKFEAFVRWDLTDEGLQGFYDHLMDVAELGPAEAMRRQVELQRQQRERPSGG